jgi:hypothetical protein
VYLRCLTWLSYENVGSAVIAAGQRRKGLEEGRLWLSMLLQTQNRL